MTTSPTPGADATGRPGLGSAAAAVESIPPTRASMVVSGWTAVSRGTGVLRVIAVAALLGPTHLGNAYLLTNSIPNLVYYGFLAGSLVSSVLVPVLVRVLLASGGRAARDVANGFLGVVLCVGAVLAPVMVLVLPVLLGLANGRGGAASAEQVQLVRVLVIMTVPQVFGYAVVGAAGAVMMAHRRFALAAAGPAVENLGVILVLVAFAAGPGPEQVTGAQLLLLGLGSTAAVGANACLQWCGAARLGARLRPTAGWRDPVVRAGLRRAGHAVGQGGLLAIQTLAALLLASRVAGGTVALQLALNFYALPIALFATPVGLALLPELSAHAAAGRTATLDRAYRQGLSLALFLVVPAATGFVLLASPLAQVVASGEMQRGDGAAMTAAALAALSAGLVGQTAFFLATQACYATGRTTLPLQCMAVQCAVFLVLGAVAAMTQHGSALVGAVAAAYAFSALTGGAALSLRTTRLRAGAAARWAARLGAGVILLAVAAWTVVTGVVAAVPGRGGALLAVAAGTLAGGAAFAAVQAACHAPELTWLRVGASRGQRQTGVGERS